MGYKLKLKCSHGNLLASKEVGHNGKLKSFYGGLPKCCLRMGSRPAEGETFIIPGYLVDMNGRLVKDD